MSEPIIYHLGLLANDREKDADLDRRATELMRRAETGEAILYQSRVAPGVFEYLALVRA